MICNAKITTSEQSFSTTFTAVERKLRRKRVSVKPIKPAKEKLRKRRYRKRIKGKEPLKLQEDISIIKKLNMKPRNLKAPLLLRLDLFKLKLFIIN